MATAPRHPADLDDDELVADVDETRTRGSGPGGQHRNKVETAVRMTHRPTGIVAEASERRELPRNRAEALRRLRVKLALEVRVERGDGDVPSELWRRRMGGGVLSLSPRHGDFAPLLAEALDVLAGCEDDAAAAAKALGTSTSRFVKLLKLEPAVLSQVNARRKARGARPWQ